MALKIFRVFIYCLPILLLVWVIYLNFLPLNNLSLNCSPWYCSPRLKIESGSLNKNLKQNQFSNNQESFYFDLNLPKGYDFTQAKVELITENKLEEIDYLNIANLLDEEVYSRKNVSYNTDNFNSLIWDKIENEEDIILYQRKSASQFKSINSFLENIPSLDQISQYNVNLSEYFKVPGYQAKNELTEINNKLIGPHNFITYLKDESLFIDLKFDSQSIKSGDSGIVSIYQISDQKRLITERSLDLNKVEEKIQIDDLPEATYAASLEIPENVIINQIKTKQHWFMFNGQVNLLNRVNNIYFTGSSIKNNQGVILQGGTNYAINSYNPEDSINLFTDGFLAFSADNIFIPPYQAIHNPGGFPSDTEEQELINYVIINNQPEDVEIKEANQETILSAIFSKEELAIINEQQIRFIIESIPHLKIKEIKVSFN